MCHSKRVQKSWPCCKSNQNKPRFLLKFCPKNSCTSRREFVRKKSWPRYLIRPIPYAGKCWSIPNFYCSKICKKVGSAIFFKSLVKFGYRIDFCNHPKILQVLFWIKKYPSTPKHLSIFFSFLQNHTWFYLEVGFDKIRESMYKSVGLYINVVRIGLRCGKADGKYGYCIF